MYCICPQTSRQEAWACNPLMGYYYGVFRSALPSPSFGTPQKCDTVELHALWAFKNALLWCFNFSHVQNCDTVDLDSARLTWLFQICDTVVLYSLQNLVIFRKSPKLRDSGAGIDSSFALLLRVFSSSLPFFSSLFLPPFSLLSPSPLPSSLLCFFCLSLGTRATSYMYILLR